MRKMPEVIVAGHICLDLIPEFKGEFRLEPNQLTSLGKMSFATGGAVANVGLALNKLGVDVTLLAKVGDDLFAKTLINTLEENAPKSSQAIIVSKSDSTSYSIVISPPDFDRHFLHHEGANNSFRPNDIDLKVVKDAKLFYFGYPPLMQQIFQDGGVAFAELLKNIKALGITTAMDLSFPDPNSPAGQVDWLKFLELVLPYTDIFLPSLAEINYMLYSDKSQTTKPELPSTAIKTSQLLLDMGVALAGIKLGSDGLFLQTASSSRLEEMGKAKPKDIENWSNRKFWSHNYEVEVKNTVGAGDATYSGFLAALLKGLSLEDSMAVASAVGACSVEGNDANSAVLSWYETINRINKGWASSKPNSKS